MQIGYGNGGWCVVTDDTAELGLPGVVYLRLQTVDGTLRITELYMDGSGEPIQPGALRKFPLSLLEQWAADDPFPDRFEVPGPDLSTLASYVGTSFGPGMWNGDMCPTCDGPVHHRSPAATGPARAVKDWVALSWFAQFRPGAGIPRPKKQQVGHRVASAPESQEPRLSAPENGLTDEFLQDVARAYKAAVDWRMPPARTLADLAGVEVKTVNSWCYKARKRGLMPPATKRGRIV